MGATAAKPQGSPRLLGAAALGAAVALTLGIYGNVHDPSNQLELELLFSSTLSMKVWLGTAAAVCVTVALVAALRGGTSAEGGADDGLAAHRVAARLAFLLSLPVAYHCLWSLGFQDTNGRVLVHSIFGCAFYGAYAAWATGIRIDGLSRRSVVLLSGALFATFVLAWWVSAFWFIRADGFPAL